MKKLRKEQLDKIKGLAKDLETFSEKLQEVEEADKLIQDIGVLQLLCKKLEKIN